MAENDKVVYLAQLKYFKEKQDAANEAKFVAQEFKTGSTTEKKVLSDNNLTDALLAKLNAAGTSSFDGQYSSLTGRPSIEGHSVVSGNQTAASLGLVATADIADMETQTHADITYLKKTEAYQLPTASATVLGGVKIGDNISIVDGKISVAAPVADSHINSLINTAITNKADKSEVTDLADNVAKTYATKQELTDSAYQLPTASASVLGGIKVGDRLTITNGVLSADVQTTDISGKLDKLEAASTYLTKTEASTTYRTEAQVKTQVEAYGYQNASQVSTAIDAKLTSAIRPKGSVAFANLPTPAADKLGFMYNVTDAFTTTANFTEGAGKAYGAGSNVVCVADGESYKWDVQGGFVDLSAYKTAADTTTEIGSLIDARGYITETKAAQTYQPIITAVANDDIDAMFA